MTKIDFFNAALLKLGSQRVLTGEGEKCPEFEVCERAYEQALKEVYTLYPWHCCRKMAELNRLYDKNLHLKFKYAYQLPIDCLYVAEVIPQRTEFEICGRIIYSDEKNLAISYTANIENIGELTPHVAELAVTNLAMKILPSLSKGSYNVTAAMLQDFHTLQFNIAKKTDVAENYSRRQHTSWIDQV